MRQIARRGCADTASTKNASNVIPEASHARGRQQQRPVQIVGAKTLSWKGILQLIRNRKNPLAVHEQSIPDTSWIL
jgi:hypothetical protein